MHLDLLSDLTFRACFCSPYARSTYRYTPLLAVALSPIWILPYPIGPVSGKVLFSFVSSFVIPKLLIQPPLQASTLYTHLIWTLNPIILNINTRGSSESLLVAMVLGTLVMVKRRSMTCAAALWALSVHWKVYPIIYAAPILIELHMMDNAQILTWNKLRFALISATVFALLSGVCWSM